MRDFCIDMNRVKGLHNKSYKECIGSGRAYESLIGEHQRQLAYVRKECGFKYIRFHGIFHDDMAVYSEDEKGSPLYNWQYVDMVYDFI
ncbi:MAG: glycoside hydrolase, partial [Chitinophagaceae bacterium]|nr:glycoside hydrolase [Chitinophagaceae bacterium]